MTTPTNTPSIWPNAQGYWYAHPTTGHHCGPYPTYSDALAAHAIACDTATYGEIAPADEPVYPWDDKRDDSLTPRPDSREVYDEDPHYNDALYTDASSPWYRP